MTNVLSANLFALLGDDGDDDVPVLKSAPKLVATEQPATKSQKEKPEQRNERSERGAGAGDRSGRGGGNRGSRGGGNRGDGERGRGGNRGGRGDGEYKPRPRRDEDGIQRAPRFQEPTEDGFERKESSYKPRGNRRGGPPGRGAFRGHREFDRHSGNNWEDSEKKEIAGKGTWGDAVESQVVELEVKAEDAVVPDVAVETPVDEAKEEKKEEAPSGKTLAEYQAELAAKRASLSATTIRVANEGADEAKWADSVKFTRVEEGEAIFVGKERAKKEKIKERSVKVSVDIEQRFSDEGRRGGYRGGGRGRGGERGRGRGGDDRRGRSGKQALNINDESAFPSLSK